MLPLANLSGDSQQEYLADGMTDALITNLGRIRALRVISRQSIVRYKGSAKPLPQIARELNVDGIVEGAVVRSGNRIRITSQLLHGRTDRHLWAETYDGDAQDLLTLQRDVAQAVAGAIKATVAPEEALLLGRVPRVNAQAYEAFLKGQSHWYGLSPGHLDLAYSYFEQALEKDPGFALAYAGIANVWMVRADSGLVPPIPALAKSREAATTALAIDETLSQGHLILGNIAALYDHDAQAGERAFRRAIDLDPNNSDAHMMYADFLASMKRWDESAAQFRQALELDPVSPFLLCFHGAMKPSCNSARHSPRSRGSLRRTWGCGAPSTGKGCTHRPLTRRRSSLLRWTIAKWKIASRAASRPAVTRRPCARRPGSWSGVPATARSHACGSRACTRTAAMETRRSGGLRKRTAIGRCRSCISPWHGTGMWCGRTRDSAICCGAWGCRSEWPVRTRRPRYNRTMKQGKRLLFSLYTLTLLLLSQAALSAQDFSGTWSLLVNGYKGELYLKQEGSRVTGWLGWSGVNLDGDTITGTIQGNEINFTRTNPTLRPPQQWRGFISIHNNPAIEARRRATGPDTMAGIGNHQGAWNFSWSAVRQGPYREQSGTAPVPVSTPANTTATAGGGCGLGVRWTESENGWDGQWVRRGSTNTFDATWRSGGTTVTSTLTIMVTGTQVHIQRNDTDGVTVAYTGTVGADGISVTGTGKIQGRVPQGAPTGAYPFQAKILCR